MLKIKVSSSAANTLSLKDVILLIFCKFFHSLERFSYILNGAVLKHRIDVVDKKKNINENLPLTESVQYNRLFALNRKKEENIQSSFWLNSFRYVWK